jgi:hypothetical protein
VGRVDTDVGKEDGHAVDANWAPKGVG